MKHLFQLSLLLLALLLPATALAYDFEVDGIYYNRNGNEATVTESPSYNYSGFVTIPSTVTYGGTTYSVTAIGNYAFESCLLIDVIIPNSVTYIGKGAFKLCGSLTKVDISNSVIEIGEEAFKDCIGLSSISIPNSVIAINERTFENCINLTSATIGNSVTSIGDCAFMDCSGLTSIDIPSSVTSIGDCAFMDCSGLTSVTIGNSVVSIGDWAFSYCSGLTSISIPNSVTSIGNSAFSDCIGLTNVIIGNSVTTIGDEAFLNCVKLASLNIPNTVTTICAAVFACCSSLNSVTIGSSVTTIGRSAFAMCDSLTNIVVASGNPKYDSRSNSNAIIETASNTLIVGCKNTVIPNSVTSIGNSAFEYCSALTNITIPNSVSSIGDGAFSGCWNLTEIYSLALVPPTLGSDSFDYYNSLFVPYNALETYKTADYWKDFTNIDCITFDVDSKYYRVMDAGTVSVMANNNDGSLYNGDIVIPDSVIYEGYTFAVTGIEGNAFDGCYELTSITIPNSVETIGEQAFQGCTGLKSVTIGSGVKTIGAKAFNYCNALETVKCLGTVPPVMASTDCFSTAAYNRAQLLVPRNTEATYTAADYWYKFAHIDGWGSAGIGDVNGDGVMSIRDVTSLIDVLLGNELDSFYFESADLNINGRLDIGDVTSLIDNLLNGDY